MILASSKLNSNRTGPNYPLCLTEVDGKSILEHIVDKTASIKNSTYSFTFLEKEASKYHLEKIAAMLVSNQRSILVKELTQGSGCTALLASSQFNQEDELLIMSANEILDIDFKKTLDTFRERKLDAGTITFRSIHPRYSYVKLDEKGFVTEAAQQNPISLDATAGIFWYKKTKYFVDGAKSNIQKDAHVDSSFFIAPTFNEMILNQKKIGVKEIDIKKYTPLKTNKLISQSDRSP